MCRRRDLRLVELAVKRGADVYVRDRRGKRVLEGEKGADERVKVFLRQCQCNRCFHSDRLTLQQLTARTTCCSPRVTVVLPISKDS